MIVLITHNYEYEQGHLGSVLSLSKGLGTIPGGPGSTITR